MWSFLDRSKLMTIAAKQIRSSSPPLRPPKTGALKNKRGDWHASTNEGVAINLCSHTVQCKTVKPSKSSATTIVPTTVQWAGGKPASELRA